MIIPVQNCFFLKNTTKSNAMQFLLNFLLNKFSTSGVDKLSTFLSRDTIPDDKKLQLFPYAISLYVQGLAFHSNSP